MPPSFKQLPLDLEFSPAMGREDFMVGECNRYAVHLVENWPDDWHPYPALTLYGPKGSGKSHLAAVWQVKSAAQHIPLSNFRALSAEQLMAMECNIIIDHLELLIGEQDQEEKLFHLYNHFVQTGRYFLALSRVSPEQLPFEIKDLASRLRASQSAEIKPPDDDLLMRVLVKRFSDQNLKIDQESLDYILLRMERSWDGLDQLAEKIRLTATSLKKGDLTKPLIRQSLSELIDS